MRTRLVFVFYFFRSDLKTHVSIVFCISNVKQSKLKIVKYAECVYPNNQCFFYRKIQNFTVVPKRPSVFYSEMQNFETCAQTALRLFTTKHKILKTVTKRPFMFLQRNIEF